MIEEPSICAGSATVRFTYSKSANQVRFEAIFEGLPYRPSLAHRVTALRNQDLHPHSDFLLHDMGPNLDDHRRMGRASGRFWRTTPLWGLRFKGRMLHDGSAFTLEEAIATHAGEAAPSRTRYLAEWRNATALPRKTRRVLPSFAWGVAVTRRTARSIPAQLLSHPFDARNIERETSSRCPQLALTGTCNAFSCSPNAHEGDGKGLQHPLQRDLPAPCSRYASASVGLDRPMQT